ncbi:hypothetical protein, partial [Xylella fastidiosa]|uniref:hypothetical protein n=1 Tax=Xylella fastidiosa TaxID=2371 RepID=UPI001EEA3018
VVKPPPTSTDTTRWRCVIPVVLWRFDPPSLSVNLAPVTNTHYKDAQNAILNVSPLFMFVCCIATD